MSFHRLSNIDRAGGTADCKVCGPTGVFVPPVSSTRLKVMCNFRREESLRQKQVHQRRVAGPRKICRVQDVDETLLTGLCLRCGPVNVKRRIKKGKTFYTCMTSWNATMALACTAHSHGLSRAEASAFVRAVGLCQNKGCGKTLDGPGNRSNQGHVDHDHQDNIIRGVLCSDCNHALGNARDSIEVLLGLVEYLKNPPGYKE